MFGLMPVQSSGRPVQSSPYLRWNLTPVKMIKILDLDVNDLQWRHNVYSEILLTPYLPLPGTLKLPTAVTYNRLTLIWQKVTYLTAWQIFITRFNCFYWPSSSCSQDCYNWRNFCKLCINVYSVEKMGNLKFMRWFKELIYWLEQELGFQEPRIYLTIV